MRKWSRLLVVAAVLGLLGFYPLLAPPAHRIDEEHFGLIHKGMTRAEVESIFGQPPGDYDWAVAEDPGVWLWNIAGANQKIWTSTTIYAAADSNTAISEALWVELAAAATNSRAMKTRYVTTTLFLGTRINVNNNRSWTSRHGACTVWFDDNLRVAGKSDWGASRVEPPWQKWWKKCFGE